MIKFDYHIHTSHSIDSKSSMDDMILRAMDLGLEEIAITDHVDFTYPDNAILSPFGVADNVLKIREMREKYAGKISILTGIEFGLRTDTAEVTQEIADTFDFDFIIGSAHEIGEFDFSYMASGKLYQNRTKYEAYGLYLGNLLDTIIACDSWDVLGHLDYVERYGIYEDKSLHYADFSDIIDEILRYVISLGKGIELNTSGYRYGRGSSYPGADIIARYKALGGEIITIGSDAHCPAHIAIGFEEAYDVLRNMGIHHIARFKQRTPIFTKI